jgi:hypothetical protein
LRHGARLPIADAATGYQRSSRTPICIASARELVERRGRAVKASDNLFD